MTVKIDGTNTEANPAFTGADTDTGLQCGTNEVKLVTGGTTRATVDSSGSLLLGTTTARAGLTVAKGSSSIPAEGTSTGAAVFSNGTDDAVYGLVVGANTSGTGYIQSQRTDGTATTYNLAIQPNGGNVGIGVTAPLGPLHVGRGSGNAKVFIQRTNTAANTNDYGSIIWRSNAGNNNGVIGVARQAAENDGYMFFSTANGGTLSERMRISAEGYVTKPNHPAFEVSNNTGDVTSGNLAPSHVQMNRGSHYSTSTGVFTAPVTGVYCFYYGSIKSGDGNQVVRVYLQVNGVQAYDNKHLRLTELSGDYAENASIVWTHYLAKDDQVRLNVGAGAIYGSTKEYFHFGGYLIG